ncbi:MAG: 50S ribosomal protein L25 [Candidatus Absconditabacterales bacterium]
MKLTVNIRKGEKAKQLRKDGFVPAIVYGKHLKNAISIVCKKNDLIKKYKEAGYSTPITLKGEEIDQLVLIQDIQTDPVTDILIHADFLAIQKDEKVKTEVPVILSGESSIEKLGLGKIQLVRDFIEVEAFPQDLPHNIVIDISKIQSINDTIFIKDLEVSDKVKILSDLEEAIVVVLKLAEEEVEEVATTVTTSPDGTTPTEGGETKPGETKEGDKGGQDKGGKGSDKKDSKDKK